MSKSFDEKLDDFVGRFANLKSKEAEYKFMSDAIGAEFSAFLKEEGLPDNFSLVDLMALTRRKTLLK